MQKETFEEKHLDSAHSLLKRQGKKYLGDLSTLPKEFQTFIAAVNDAYNQFDEDRKMLERSLDLSSRELLQANVQMRAIFQGFPDHLFLVDQVGTVLDSKIGKDNVLGLKPERLVGQKLADTPLAKFTGLSLESITLVLAAQRTETIEYSGLINEKVIFLEIRLTPVTPDQVIIIVRDITAAKSAEIALRMSETKYRTQFESAMDAIFIMEDNVFADCNPQTLTIFQCKREEIIEKTPFQFSPKFQPDGQLSNKKGAVLIKKALAGEPQFFEWRHQRPNGVCFDAEVSLKRFDIGESTFIMAMVRNITTRKQVQEDLAAEKEKMAVTLESITEGVISTTVDGTVVFMNRVAETITGWASEDASNHPIQEVFPIRDERTDEIIANPVADIIAAGQPIDIKEHLVLVTRDGVRKDISKSGAPLRDRNNSIIGVVMVFRDVTERKKIQEEIFRARKLDSIGVLAGGIAHDFNNILTGILGNITLAKMLDQKGKMVTEKLCNAEKAALRARELTQQFLTFSKGGAPIKQTACIADLIEESIAFILRGSNVRCQFYLPKELWPVEIDKGQINQVINNIIINADQAMPDGGVITISGENLTIREGTPKLQLKRGKYIKLSIEDGGTGILPANLKKIFDPYFTTKPHGSGLGLTSSYGIIKKHGGNIFVESTLGSGTTFDIFLPASEKEVVEDATETGILKGKGRIILMDDEEVIRQSAAEQLQQLGYQVEVAQNGEELIEKYTDEEEIGETFDLVILDLTIPGGMGGEKTMEYLLEMNPEVKAIVCSGYSNNPIMSNYKKYGFRGVVAKPYKIEELSQEVRRVLLED